jgi:hypothetical protein
MDGRFVVPQFIEEETRILGKITIRQFVILLVTIIVEMIIFRFASLSFFILSLIFFAGPAAIIAFVKINGQNFHLFLVNFIQSNRRPRLRVWNKQVSMEDLRFELQRQKMAPKKEEPRAPHKELPVSSRLAELSLVVDTGGVYKGE